MVNKEDWNAAMSSEVFKEYLKISLAQDTKYKQINEDDVLNDLRELQSKIRSNPKMRQAFKILQQKFASDQKYRSQVNQQFVEGVMLLNLDGINSVETNEE